MIYILKNHSGDIIGAFYGSYSDLKKLLEQHEYGDSVMEITEYVNGEINPWD